MPSIAPLSAAQIADLYGAIDELVGTGDNLTTAYQLDFFPVVGEREVFDELVAIADGVATAYQIHYFPITAGTLTLRKTEAVSGPALADPTHYSVNLATGVVTLTPAGVAFLGTEKLFATYHIATTLELHRTTIGGSLLTEGTHYTFTPRTGQIVLTAAGVTFLGIQQLRAKYQIERGLVPVLYDSNGGLRSAIVQTGIQRDEFNAKDQDLRFIHESIETKAILDIEGERRQLLGPTVSSPVTEGQIVSSVTNYAAPLYPVPPVGDPTVPAQNVNLFGGSGNFSGNERNRINQEQTESANVQANYPIPPNTQSDRFGSTEGTDMIFYVTGQITALTNEIAFLTSFLAQNPVPNDHVSAGDITNANTALTNANAQLATTQAFLTSLNTFPFNGFSDASLAARQVVLLARENYIDNTRSGQISTLLTFLWGRRFFWIAQRARLADGTLAQKVNADKAITNMNAQIAANTTRINDILAILAAQ